MRLHGAFSLLAALSLSLLTWTLPAHAGHNQDGCMANFEVLGYRVDESVGSLTITVRSHRKAKVAGAGFGSGGGATVSDTDTKADLTRCDGSVTYETVAGTARAHEDFRSASGRLTFVGDDEEWTASFDIEIVDDGRDESEESFEIRLTAPDGEFVTVGPPTTVVIERSDSPSSARSGAVGSSSDERSQTGSEPNTRTDAGASASLDGAGDGWTVADRAPAAQGVGIAGEPEDTSASAVTDGAILAMGLAGGSILFAIGWVRRTRMYR